MDLRETMDEALRAVAETARKLSEENDALRARLAHLPSCEHDVTALLDELAAAEADCGQHFSGRFPHEQINRPYDEQPEHVRADWHRCCERRTKAVEALTRYAQARVDARKQAA